MVGLYEIYNEHQLIHYLHVVIDDAEASGRPIAEISPVIPCKLLGCVVIVDAIKHLQKVNVMNALTLRVLPFLKIY